LDLVKKKRRKKRGKRRKKSPQDHVVALVVAAPASVVHRVEDNRNKVQARVKIQTERKSRIAEAIIRRARRRNPERALRKDANRNQRLLRATQPEMRKEVAQNLRLNPTGQEAARVDEIVIIAAVAKA